MIEMYAWQAERAIERGDHEAHAYWGRLFHAAKAGQTILL